LLFWKFVSSNRFWNAVLACTARKKCPLPEVEKHQMYELKREPKIMKTLLLGTMLLLTPQPIF
jgi:hypothetical protein